MLEGSAMLNTHMYTKISCNVCYKQFQAPQRQIVAYLANAGIDISERKHSQPQICQAYMAV